MGHRISKRFSESPGGTQCIALKSDALSVFGGAGYCFGVGPACFSSKGGLFQYDCLCILLRFSECPSLGKRQGTSKFKSPIRFYFPCLGKAAPEQKLTSTWGPKLLWVTVGVYEILSVILRIARRQSHSRVSRLRFYAPLRGEDFSSPLIRGCLLNIAEQVPSSEGACSPSQSRSPAPTVIAQHRSAGMHK